MEPERATPPPWLPATRSKVPPPVVPEPPPEADPPPPNEGRALRWRRLTRSRRGAAGLAIAVAALLLWPFSGWSWIPWLAGIGLLVLLRLLRLDGLLRGWALHLGGLVVVAGLMYSTGPWAWALAASIGVLLAGLVQLPWWRLAAVGAAMCVISGVGFGFVSYQDAQEVAAVQAQTQLQSRGAQGASRPTGVLPVLLSRIGQNVPGPICDNLLAEPARAAFVRSVGQTDCAAAVGALAARVADPTNYERAKAPSAPSGDGLQVDACSLTWGNGAVAGPQLGKLTIGRKEGGATYVVTAFAAC
jgi:hypothetical protein